MAELLQAHRDDVDVVSAALRDPADLDLDLDLDAAVDRLLAAHRTRGGLAALADAWLRSDAEEQQDRDDLPDAVRERLLSALHRFNGRVGSYVVFANQVEVALGPLRGAHVYDLAAGTGGFARHLARHPLPARELRVTSSDRHAGYVRIGTAAAQADGAAVAFEVRDACDLAGITDVDLFVCTQASHHLSAGTVVRMIHQAIRAAPRGILIIDLLRSVTNWIGAGVVVPFLEPIWTLVRDGMLSVRRSWLPSELALCARLAGAREVEARAIGPAFCSLHAMGVD